MSKEMGSAPEQVRAWGISLCFRYMQRMKESKAEDQKPTFLFSQRTDGRASHHITSHQSPPFFRAVFLERTNRTDDHLLALRSTDLLTDCCCDISYFFVGKSSSIAGLIICLSVYLSIYLSIEIYNRRHEPTSIVYRPSIN